MNTAPLGPIAGAYYTDNSGVAIIEGPVGSGKSVASCLRLARHAYEQKPGPDGVARTRFAIVRNTKPQLRDTTIKTWLSTFPESLYGQFLRGDNLSHVWSFKPKGYDYPIHAEFIFRALDDEKDVANLLSLEVTGFWLNECREASREIVSHLRARCRYLGGERPHTWSGWIGDTNPWDTEHWLEDALVTNPREGWRHFRQPGGMDEDAENLSNLEQTDESRALPFDHPTRRDLGRQYYRRLLNDYTAEEARVYVHAQRGRTRTGKPIYTEYNDLTHCRPFELDPKLPLRIGMDFGRTPAAVIAQRTATGAWRIRRELCGFDIGAKPFAEQLKRYLAEYFPDFRVAQFTGDPSGEARDARDETVFELVNAVGFNAKAAPTNDPSLRIGAVQDALRRITEGSPALLIHPDCKMLRRACIDGYHYRRLKVAGERYHDEPDKNDWSHVAEALQYLLLGAGEGRAMVARPKGPPRRDRGFTEYDEFG